MVMQGGYKASGVVMICNDKDRQTGSQLIVSMFN